MLFLWGFAKTEKLKFDSLLFPLKFVRIVSIQFQDESVGRGSVPKDQIYAYKFVKTEKLYIRKISANSM